TGAGGAAPPTRRRSLDSRDVRLTPILRREVSAAMTMELELDLGQDYSQNQTMKVSPRLVAANYILELSSQELQQQISTELSENPALELVETPTCRVCGTELQGSICPRCIQRQKVGSSSPYGPEGHTSPYDDVPEGRTRGPDDEEFD